MWIPLDIIQIKFEFRHAWPTFTGVIALCCNLVFQVFSAVFSDTDLKFGIWICLDTIQIKFEFRYAWPTFIGVIALCWNLVYPTFFCCLLRNWLESWYMILSWHNTDQVRVSSRLTYFYRSYCPLLKCHFPDFSLLSFEILTWNLVYEFFMT